MTAASTFNMKGLSSDKRRLLQQLLAEEGVAQPQQTQIPRRSDDGPPPLSFTQQRIWLLDRLEPGSHYNDYLAWRLTGALNLEAFQQSLNAIMQRHAVWRTTFSVKDNEPVQVIDSARRLPLRLVDVRNVPAAERETMSARELLADIQQPFSLEAGPLLRTTLVQLESETFIFLLTIHQISNDSWSLGVFIKELITYYNAFCLGQTPTLPDLPIQYADYAAWQRERFQGEVLEKQLDYWLQQLTDAPQVLEIPTDHPRPISQTFNGSRQPLDLPPALIEGLKDLSKREGVTLFMTLLAAFKLLLYRYSGQPDISVGSPIANRNRSELEGLLGVFINTLVLRTDLAGNPTFRELIQRVQQTTLGGFSHPELPFERLVEALQPERDLSYTPLFQVMFDFHNTPMPKLDLNGLSAESYPLDGGMARFDLTLDLLESGGEVHGHFEYNTDLFNAETMGRMALNFQALLEDIVAHPDKRLADLTLLAAEESRQLLVDWNATQTPYPSDTCVHQLFEAQAANTPDQVALLFEEETLTYDALNRQANQVAHYLQSLGVGPGVFVGICLERSPQMMVALLGILKAGGAYVPLDPAYPKDRLAYILEDTQAPVLLTQQSLLTGLPDAQTRQVCLETNWHEITAQPDENPVSPANGKSDHLAYVIHTSGSTGKPKGVQIPHRALTNFLLSMAAQPGMTAQDTLLAVTTLSFDIHTLELFLPLIVGGRIALVSRETAVDGPALRRRLSQTETTVMQATPATWRLLLESEWQGDEGLKILCGGEPLPPDLAAQLLSRCGSLWNMYGPTETTVWSSVDQIQPQDDPISIGRPIANTQMYVLDVQLQPVPVGAPGELYIGGDGLAAGYLNRPDLTAERFLTNPLDVSGRSRLYRTGDMARYLPDGRLECLGRVDHQVKVRGFRIELGEIEAVLNRHTEVADCVVMAREDTPHDKRLVAYIIPEEETVPAPAELRQFLQESLPDYMLPAAFVSLESFPLTPNRKVDRKALPAPEADRADPVGDFMAAQDALELQLINIWEAVLNRHPIGIKDNFFELGGHSLLAVRLFAQVEELTGHKLPLAVLFQAPTVQSLADMLRNQGWVSSWSSLVPIRPGGSKPPFFCVHGAGGNVLEFYPLAQHLEPDQPFYGLQAQGLDGSPIEDRSIEAMAAHYIQEMRSLQPVGPYYIGGYCFGGVVAFEIARQLQDQGEEVGLLAMLHTESRVYPQPLPHISSWQHKAYYLWRRLKLELTNLAVRDRKQKIAYLKERVQHTLEVAQVRLAQSPRLSLGINRYLLPDQDSITYKMEGVKAANTRAFWDYQPKPYHGPVVIFSASEECRGIQLDPLLGWGEWINGQTQVCKIPGHQENIVDEPFVQGLADQLNTHLH